MNDDIIRMAREAGFSFETGQDLRDNIPALERFAAIVAAHEREKQPEHFAKAIAELVKCCRVLAEENEAAVLAEREACAKVVESGVLGHGECAAAIRARGEK